MDVSKSQHYVEFIRSLLCLPVLGYCRVFRAFDGQSQDHRGPLQTSMACANVGRLEHHFVGLHTPRYRCLRH